MADTDQNWDLALDQAGGAAPATLRLSGGLAAVIVVAAVAVIAFGDVRLAPFPQFTTFHAGFVFVVDGIVAALLFGQFASRRQVSYAVLGAAYLFSALIVIPFLFAFPGALKAEDVVIGGSQSSIWLWHFWHILYPALVVLALLAHERAAGHTVPVAQVVPYIWWAAGGATALVLLLTATVTVFHDQLPTLITGQRVPLAPGFYVAGGIATAVTGTALILAVRAARRRALLHVWLTVVLTAFLADVFVSLTSTGRFTAGWYFGRVESMIAAAILLLVFLGEINKLYRRLGSAVGELFSANRRLAVLVEEKEGLVAQLQRREEEIRQLAYYDPVTELPNRRLLMDRLNHDLAQARRHGQATALLFLDLDRFKEINDRHGHEVGDALLRAVAATLNHCVRSVDTVARLGGDEFVILLPEIAKAQDAEAVAAKVIEALDRPMSVAGRSLHITTSIGIVIGTRDAPRNATELLARADAAMYAAKKAGRNRYSLGG